MIGVSISNQKPILDCFMKLDPETEYFIQLDNGIYNHGVTIKSDEGEAIKLKSKKDKEVAKQKLLKNQAEGSKQAKLLSKLGISVENFLSYNNMFYCHGDDVRKETLDATLKKMAEEIEEVSKEFGKTEK